jgi:hypothetical protein
MPDILKDEAETQRLRQGLHQRIDRLPPGSLAAADRLLLQIEASQLREELDSAFDKDRAESKLSPEKVGNAIALHRARHPYGG